MKKTQMYCSYQDYTAIFDCETRTFDVCYKKNPIIKDAYIEGIYRGWKKIMDTADYPICETSSETGRYTQDFHFMTLNYKKTAEDEKPALTIKIFVGISSVWVTAIEPQNVTVKVAGVINAEAKNKEDIFAVSLERQTDDLRCAIGSAVSRVDHAVYNRTTDVAIAAGKSGETEITLCKKCGKYKFITRPGVKEFHMWQKDNVLADKYSIKFSAMNRNTKYKLPPVGWMTWYAVKFDACEEKVLTNAKWQAENLAEYGANTVWVDWEWYHKDMEGVRDDGVNSLMCDPVKYPNGMKYVADKIKEMGMIPALWISNTNEPCTNEFIEKYPDIVLVDDKTWCGHYYYDFSHPDYLERFLPASVSNVHKWGYEVVKLDTIPISLSAHEKNHGNMYDPTLTTREAFIKMVEKTREVLGKDMYMLSCSGYSNSSVLWASHIFDAARIGADVFNWHEYRNTIPQIMLFYPLHNIQLYNDTDNVVLREEFNDIEQAKTRTVMTSLLGLPMTFGDEFSALDDARINLIKRALPILDVHPTDFSNAIYNNHDYIINLEIEKPWEEYNVSGVINMAGEEDSRILSLCEDFHLDDGEYLVFDYYHDKLLGKFTDKLPLDFLPYESRVLAFRKKLDRPQIVSTSRHITQGAAEIVDMKYEDDKLTLTASLIKDDSYTVSIYVPCTYKISCYEGFDTKSEDGNLVRLTMLPKKTGEYSFTVCFEKR